jgi:hypothetical protein
MNEHETNLRDLAAMFAMCGLLLRGGDGAGLTDEAYDIADDFMESRDRRPEQGIAAIKPKRKYERKSAD